MFTDRMLKCADCSNEFAFSAAEQQFWEERGFRFPPRRCKDCRRKRRDSEGGGEGGGGGARSHGDRPPRDASKGPRESHPATCSQCGAVTTVPFKPDPARATFCRDCYGQRKKR